MTASSYYNEGCTPKRGILHTEESKHGVGAWCSKTNNQGEYLEVWWYINLIKKIWYGVRICQVSKFDTWGNFSAKSLTDFNRRTRFRFAVEGSYV